MKNTLILSTRATLKSVGNPKPPLANNNERALHFLLGGAPKEAPERIERECA